MRVPQFMVGFGPTVFSRRRGETEYGLKAIPLGGYIRIVGMIPPAEEGESKRATRMRSFIAEVRGQALNDVLPTDDGRVFYTKPWWQRVIVMFAGPFNNLVLAVLFFTIVLTAFGAPSHDDDRTRPRVRAARRRASADADDPCAVPITAEGQLCEAGAGLRAAERSPAAEGRSPPRRHHRRHRRRAGRPRDRGRLDRRSRRPSGQPRAPGRLHRRARRRTSASSP